jgi:hypothetical protein
VGVFGQRFSPNLDTDDYFIPLFNDGSLTRNDICKNYADIQAVVIMILKKDDDIIVPIFKDYTIAKDFAKRNMPEKIYGCTTLSRTFLKTNGKDYIYELLDFPKRINFSLGYEITGEIMDHDDKISLIYH